MYLFDTNNKLTEIDLEEVWTIESKDHQILFRVGANHFCPPINIKQLAEVYNRFGFHEISRGVLLNLNLVERAIGDKYYIEHHGFKVSRRNELSIKQQFDKIR